MNPVSRGSDGQQQQPILEISSSNPPADLLAAIFEHTFVDYKTEQGPVRVFALEIRVRLLFAFLPSYFPLQRTVPLHVSDLRRPAI